jgi:parallel beta-helix repeat protein
MISTAALIGCSLFFSAPAIAADGAIIITQAKALAGNVTPGDAAGFPVSITTPGSYVLASNLQPAANKTGVLVNATEVSIDLNGFRMNGGGGTAGIGVDGHQRSLTVRNGTIRNFGFAGIHSIGALMIVDNMRVEENGQFGVYVEANGYARIVNSTIFGNGYDGISCGNSCHIEGNIISANRARGVFISGSGGTLLGNTIYSNSWYGLISLKTSGFGNNTIIGNVQGQIVGPLVELFPNACSPQAC